MRFGSGGSVPYRASRTLYPRRFLTPFTKHDRMALSDEIAGLHDPHGARGNPRRAATSFQFHFSHSRKRFGAAAELSSLVSHKGWSDTCARVREALWSEKQSSSICIFGSSVWAHRHTCRSSKGWAEWDGRAFGRSATGPLGHWGVHERVIWGPSRATGKPLGSD